MYSVYNSLCSVHARFPILINTAAGATCYLIFSKIINNYPISLVNPNYLLIGKISLTTLALSIPFEFCVSKLKYITISSTMVVGCRAILGALFLLTEILCYLEGRKIVANFIEAFQSSQMADFQLNLRAFLGKTIRFIVNPLKETLLIQNKEKFDTTNHQIVILSPDLDDPMKKILGEIVDYLLKNRIMYNDDADNSTLLFVEKPLNTKTLVAGLSGNYLEKVKVENLLFSITGDVVNLTNPNSDFFFVELQDQINISNFRYEGPLDKSQPFPIPKGYKFNRAFSIAFKTEDVGETSPSEVNAQVTESQAESNIVYTEQSTTLRPYPGDLPLDTIKTEDTNGFLEIKFEDLLKQPQVTIRQQDMFLSGADVLVNAANIALSGGGGIDGDIHQKGGDSYRVAHQIDLKSLYPDGYISGHAAMIIIDKLNVIVVAGPIYFQFSDESKNKEQRNQLYSCYYNALLLAHQQNKKHIAFPSISTGTFGFPLDKASPISLRAIHDFSRENPNSSIEEISIHFKPGDQNGIDSYKLQ